MYKGRCKVVTLRQKDIANHVRPEYIETNGIANIYLVTKNYNFYQAKV